MEHVVTSVAAERLSVEGFRSTRKPWRVVALAALMLGVVACAGPVVHREPDLERTARDRTTATGRATMAAPLPPDLDGPLVAWHLLERYVELQEDCRKDASDTHPLPAPLCSGILLRTVPRGPGYHVWNPNPNNSQPNGTSFSWLRRDHAMSVLAWGAGSGYVILPRFYADNVSDGYTQLTVLCAFALDGWTNNRRSAANDGCGETPGVARTGPCQDVGITTYQQWLAAFEHGGFAGNQCGVRLLPGTPGASAAFDQLKHVRYRIPNAIKLTNEIMVGTWAQNDKHLPIEAFFYLNGNESARHEAFANQADFRAFSGRLVPVIRITLPNAVWGDAAFWSDPTE